MKTNTHILPAAILAFFLTSCEKTLFAPEPEADPVSIFETVWNDFDQHYAPFEERGVDWQALYEQYRPQIGDYSSGEDLYNVLTNMMKHLDDGHVQLTVPGRKVFYANYHYDQRPEEHLFDLAVVRGNYLNLAREEQGEYTTGWAGPGILYIHFPYVGPNWAMLSKMLDEYPDTRGLIIDLRQNQGGDFTFAFEHLARLSPEKRLVFSSKTKNGPGKDDFTPWHKWHLEAGDPYLQMEKIVVLTDRLTISAGERAVMGIRALPNAIQIGDTTNGAHSTMIGRELANGWYYTLAIQKVILADGNSYEGIGMIPDIFVKNTPEELENGIDQVLETALEQFQ